MKEKRKVLAEILFVIAILAPLMQIYRLLYRQSTDRTRCWSN